jgi:hypothetical protein
MAIGERGAPSCRPLAQTACPPIPVSKYMEFFDRGLSNGSIVDRIRSTVAHLCCDIRLNPLRGNRVPPLTYVFGAGIDIGAFRLVSGCCRRRDRALDRGAPGPRCVRRPIASSAAERAPPGSPSAPSRSRTEWQSGWELGRASCADGSDETLLLDAFMAAGEARHGDRAPRVPMAMNASGLSRGRETGVVAPKAVNAVSDPWCALVGSWVPIWQLARQRAPDFAVTAMCSKTWASARAFSSDGVVSVSPGGQ